VHLVPKGIDFIVGLLQGIVQKAVEVTSWFTGLAGKVLTWVGNVVGTLLQKGIDIIAGLLNGIIQKAAEVTSWFTGLGTMIYGVLRGAVDWLVQIGKNILQGLWNGLKDKWNDIKNWFGDRVNDVKEIFTSGFGILSPSKVFKGYGENLMAGLRIGMNSEWATVDRWLAQTTDNIKTASTQGINNAINAIANQVGNISEFNPTITPVLDLSKVRAASTDLDGMLGVSSISPGVSYGTARAISSATNISSTSSDATGVAGPTEIKFEQHNYSPEALSTADIYRNTKSQIALAKEELKIA
jgi:hypothetical protein